LYRVFAQNDDSIADTIWRGRLEQAYRLLGSAGHTHLSISEVAFRSGFVDQPTFNRMFKRRYGMTPRAARQG
jgi:AraC-like DNA-binding protein